MGVGPLVVWTIIGAATLTLIVAGALRRWKWRQRLPHDLREVGVEGLPSEASIRSGELGRGAGHSVWYS